MILTRSDQESVPAPVRNGGAQPLVRLLVLTPIVALAFVMVNAAFHHTWEGSISAYHGGQFRDVFVGALIGIAVALIAYWGVTALEDYAFTIAGFYAVLVAVIPSNIAEQVEIPPQDGELPIRSVVKIIVTGYLVAAAFLTFTDYRRGAWSTGWVVKGVDGGQATAGAKATRVAGLLSAGLLVVYCTWLLVHVFFVPDTVFPYLHLSAAVLLFVHLWLAIVGQGWDWMPQDIPQSPARRQLYRAVAVAMVVGVVVALGLGVAAAVSGFTLPTLVLWIELYEIACFAVYWVSELVRFWGVDDSAGRAPLPTGADAQAD